MLDRLIRENTKNLFFIEKRQVPRWKVEKHALCQNEGETECYDLELKDLNCSGAGVSTLRDISFGKKVRLYVELLDKKINLSGEVVWVQQKDFHNLAGIHFYNTDEKNFEIISNYINDIYDSDFRHHIFDGWN